MMRWKSSFSAQWSTAISEPITSKQQRFHDGIILFNSSEFFKAHEVWEEIWLAATEPDKTFLQGLIQLAAAFHHYSRGNRKGAHSLAETALAKLDKFSANYWGINVAVLRGATRDWLATAPNRPQCIPVPVPNIQSL